MIEPVGEATVAAVEFQSDTIRLADGSRVRIRAAGRDDAPGLLEFMHALRPASELLRVLPRGAELEHVAQRVVSADTVDRISLVALEDRGEIVGFASCERLYGPRAEVTVEIDERRRRLGLSAILLRQLRREAVRVGITHLIAEVMPDAELLRHEGDSRIS